jgi:hypothetical protein
MQRRWCFTGVAFMIARDKPGAAAKHQETGAVKIKGEANFILFLAVGKGHICHNNP